MKLLNSLYRGRHVIVNGKMVNQTGLEKLCVVEDNPKATQKLITELMNTPFPDEQIQARKQLLEDGFSNRHNALLIAKTIFGNY